MLNLFYAPTTNGLKITIMLRELGVDYNLIPINIRKKDQFLPAFLEISPNNKIPAIKDGELTIFESGAILLYLAEKYGKLIGENAIEKAQINQWLFWQVGGFGPILGQAMYYNGTYDKNVNVPEAKERFLTETKRLYSVLDKQLSTNDYVAGANYSIADIANYTWALLWKFQGMDIADYPHIQQWIEKIGARPAVQQAYGDERKNFDYDHNFTNEELIERIL